MKQLTKQERKREAWDYGIEKIIVVTIYLILSTVLFKLILITREYNDEKLNERIKDWTELCETNNLSFFQDIRSSIHCVEFDGDFMVKNYDILLDKNRNNYLEKVIVGGTE